MIILDIFNILYLMDLQNPTFQGIPWWTCSETESSHTLMGAQFQTPVGELKIPARQAA